MKEQRGNIREPQGTTGGQQGPQKFGNYDLVRRIDVGGMGEVYLARQRTAFGREVAVKIIRSDLAYDGVARKRFLREAEVSAHLKHEHILPLFEFGEEQGRLFLVTPYIKGGTLAQRLQQGPLSYGEIYQLFKALAQAIAYIHKRGVIHRDLKPNNILLDRAEDSDQVYVRLIDFGIASLQGALASPPLTTADHEVGTLAYMAPERIDGIAAPSNDIYSLGVILSQMITGRLPDSSTKVKLPSPLAEVVTRCMEPDPTRRFASADILLLAFEQAYRLLRASPEQRPSGLSDKFPAVSSTEARSESIPPRVPFTPVQRDNISASTSGVSQPHAYNESTPAAQPATSGTQKPLNPLVAGNVPRAENKASDPHLEHNSRPPQEKVVLTREEFILPPRDAGSFQGGDYDAPTSFVDPAQLRLTPSTTKSGGRNTPRPPRPRRSLGALIPIAIVAIIVVIIGMSLYAFQSAISARVSFSPQVRAISKVYTIKAVPGQQNSDTNAGTIPVSEISKTKTGTRSGPATGRPFLCLINCPTVVSSDDVVKLGIETKQDLIGQLTQELNNEVRSRNATAIGKPIFRDRDSSYEPEVGKKSSSVSITLTEEGKLSYYSNSDAQGIARQKLLQDAGTNFELVSSTTRVGQPVLKSIDDRGTVTLLIPIASVARYKLSSSAIQDIQTHIKGLKVKDARAYISTQAGIDPKSVAIQNSYGDTLPGNVQQITMVSVNPTDMPSVQLPSVPTPKSSSNIDDPDDNDENMAGPGLMPGDPGWIYNN
ncbi:serine/threonine-protein kinase [Ktedonospora formicarum]|uniref:Protein kinase domain-containing protein n=1 Tax=Ktedonospora formicarum TaxID=2778364 RepID=A0A8J3I3S9_9CHLR|nr:serine/threonine-protein kinase [Ktedonospora formicarum]GHO44334.1 hypothetical protein KSX_24970 [Ktedonospora formicarum]